MTVPQLSSILFLFHLSSMKSITRISQVLYIHLVCICHADALLFPALCDILRLGALHICSFEWQEVAEKERTLPDFHLSFY